MPFADDYANQIQNRTVHRRTAIHRAALQSAYRVVGQIILRIPVHDSGFMRIKPAEAKHYDEQINRCKDDFPLVLCRKLFYLVHSTPLLRIILSLQRVEQDLHQVAVALEAGDLGGCFAGGRVGAGHGDLAGLQAQLGRADA